ncbi:MAG: hypothetical protein HFE97_05710 [Oscillospiraceae bacterium]|nr:hypothetical protein [Oscillospiraceae bacterium]
MEEQKLYECLGQALEVPDVVNQKLEQTYDKLTRRKGLEKPHGRPAVRTALIAAAAIAVLCVTATAAYYLVRQNVEVDMPQTVQGLVGQGQPSWERMEVYDEAGHLIYWPRRDMAQVDEGQAQALLGDCLPGSGYRWQIEDYSFTVEGYVLDEHTGTAKIYYVVERPGGFGADAVDWERGFLNYAVYKLDITFSALSDVETDWFGSHTFVDVSRSTEEKLCLVESAARDGGWRAEDGLHIDFTVRGEDGEALLTAGLELPGLKSLPAQSVSDPASGAPVLELSAIGLALKCTDIDQVDNITLDFADGSRYVVQDSASGLDNRDYALGTGESPDMVLQVVFNRLVDPSQVTAVTVDGQRYAVS